MTTTQTRPENIRSATYQRPGQPQRWVGLAGALLISLLIWALVIASLTEAIHLAVG
jgi:hypothetical protein